MKVTEGIVGYWHYHISEDYNKTRSLCGAPVMDTSMPLKDWGMSWGEHLPKKPTYCQECDAIYKSILDEQKE